MKINVDITLHVKGSVRDVILPRPIPSHYEHDIFIRATLVPPHLSMTVNLFVNILKQKQIHGSEIKKQPFIYPPDQLCSYIFLPETSISKTYTLNWK